MKKISSLIYGIFGTIAIVFGTATLLIPAALHSDTEQSVPFAHNLREQGAAFVFVGLMAFWCIFNYDRKRTVHYFLTLFTFLIAGVHWFEYLGGRLPWVSLTYNTIPFLAFLAMAIFDRKDNWI